MSNDFYERVAEAKREVAKRSLDKNFQTDKETLEMDVIALAGAIEEWEREAAMVRDATAEWQRTAHFPRQQFWGEQAENLLVSIESRLATLRSEDPTVEMPIPPPPPRA